MNARPRLITAPQHPVRRYRAGLLGATTLAAALVLSACTSAPTAADGGDRADRTASPGPVETPAPSRSGAPAAAGGAGDEYVERVTAAATAFLGTLSADQRELAVYEADDPALREWTYFPTAADRNGVALGDLDETQRAAALGVAEALLSDEGYTQLREVIAAEEVLGERNSDPSATADRYFLAFFGEPGADERFSVQINGHHLAVNHTFEGGRVSPTPAFTGVDPVDFDVDGERLRPMLAETQAMSVLLLGLDESTLSAARISPADDLRVGTGRSDGYPAPEGILIGELESEHRERVMSAIEAWVGDADEQIAAQLLEDYRSELDRTRLGWSGSTDPDTPGAYLRIDGPRLWIEFANVGRFGNGDNHYHSVYRDKQADYLGGDEG